MTPAANWGFLAVGGPSCKLSWKEEDKPKVTIFCNANLSCVKAFLGKKTRQELAL